AAGLPDALVGLVPVQAHPVDQGAELVPVVAGDRVAPRVVEVDGADERPVDVELELVGGGVADPYRRGAPIALQMIELLLGQVAAMRAPQRSCWSWSPAASPIRTGAEPG